MNGNSDYENSIETRINNKLFDYPELTGFVDYLSDKNSLNTSYNYLIQVIRFLEMTDKDDSELSYSDYIKYLSTLKNKTNGYQRCAHFALKRYSEYLLHSNKATEDPMRDVDAPKNVESNRTREKRENAYLTKEEIELMLDNLKHGVGSVQAKTIQEQWKERDTAIILLFLSTGISSANLFKLDLDSINWDSSTITVMNRGNKAQEFVLPAKTIQALQAWIEKRQIILRGRKEEALFISKNRNRLSQASISRLVQKYTFDVEGKRITPHMLRATYGVQLYSETKDLRFVQEQMGHSNLQSTELYIRDDQRLNSKKASDIMSKFLD